MRMVVAILALVACVRGNKARPDARPNDASPDSPPVAKLGLQPSSIDFGLVSCGTTSTLPVAQRTVTLTNPGALPYQIASATLARGATSPYMVTLPIRPIVAPGDTAAIVVLPKPIPASSLTTSDLYGDTLSIATDIPGDAVHTIALHQTAAGAILQLVPAASLWLGSVTVGTTSEDDVIVVNAGNADVTEAAQLSNVATFNIDPKTTSVMHAGDTRAESVRFTPKSAGHDATTLSLTATDTVLCAPLPTIVVSGNGV
jgi:hypothetical protein